jgi:hypothetical protein
MGRLAGGAEPGRNNFSQYRDSSLCRRSIRVTRLIAKQPRNLLRILLALFSVSLVSAQEPAPAPAPGASPAYTPKFRGDPARSDSEAAALAYMRVVMRAEVGFNKHYGHYAATLRELVHSGTFTQRMVDPDRGDYTVGYKAKKDSFMLTLTPKSPDPGHRWFYAEEDGKIHADESKPANGDSPVVETHHW